MIHKRHFEIKSWHFSADTFQKLFTTFKVQSFTCFLHPQLSSNSFPPASLIWGSHTNRLSVPPIHGAFLLPSLHIYCSPCQEDSPPLQSVQELFPQLVSCLAHLNPQVLAERAPPLKGLPWSPPLVTYPTYFSHSAYDTPYLSFLLHHLH